MAGREPRTSCTSLQRGIVEDAPGGVPAHPGFGILGTVRTP